LLDVAKALICCPKGQWWWPKEEGALGQAYQAGLISKVQGQRFVDAMPSKARAHFCSVTPAIPEFFFPMIIMAGKGHLNGRSTWAQ